MKKVAICGTSRTLREAPFTDDTFEFWICNDMHQVVKGFHRIFEMHPRKGYLENYVCSNGLRQIDALASFEVPVYMLERHEDIPYSIPYPINDVVNKLGRRYFRSTIDYMIALAIYEGFEEIHIYGVDMAVDTEYGTQRPSCEYWIGLAEGKGINVFLPNNCDLLKAYYLYGYNYNDQTDFQMKARAKVEQLERELNEHQKNYWVTLGIKDTWNFIKREIK